MAEPNLGSEKLFWVVLGWDGDTVLTFWTDQVGTVEKKKQYRVHLILDKEYELKC